MLGNRDTQAAFSHSCKLVLQDVPSFLCLFICRICLLDPITVSNGSGQISFSSRSQRESMEERDSFESKVFSFPNRNLYLVNQCLLAVRC